MGMRRTDLESNSSEIVYVPNGVATVYRADSDYSETVTGPMNSNLTFGHGSQATGDNTLWTKWDGSKVTWQGGK
jgi:hypothetical protein